MTPEKQSTPGGEGSESRLREIERSIIKRYRNELWSRFTKAVNEYGLINEGDRIAVCISGGKDSTLMAKLFQELERHGVRNFSAEYLVMDPGYSTENREKIIDNAAFLGIPVTVFESEIFRITDREAQSPCYLCARMRRGALYARAKEMGCNKIALGHHYDDVIETVLMGLLYSGQYQTMMPKLHSTNFPGMELIRPMYLIREADIIRWRDSAGLEFLQCACRLTKELAVNPSQAGKRAEVKKLIKELAVTNPFAEANIFRSAENVSLNTVISYKDRSGQRHHFLDDYDQCPGS